MPPNPDERESDIRGEGTCLRWGWLGDEGMELEIIREDGCWIFLDSIQGGFFVEWKLKGLL